MSGDELDSKLRAELEEHVSQHDGISSAGQSDEHTLARISLSISALEQRKHIRDVTGGQVRGISVDVPDSKAGQAPAEGGVHGVESPNREPD